MNIVLVVEDFVLSGVTRHVIDLANGLAEQGHTVYVAATPGSQTNRLSAQVTFIPLTLCYPNSFKKNYKGLYSSIRILLRFVQNNNIDILHTHKRYADILGHFVARRSGVIHIATCHNEFRNYKWFSAFGDITIAPCPEIAHMLENDFKLHRGSIQQIFYGIKPLKPLDDKKIIEIKNSFNIEPGCKVLLSVGHLNRQKDRPTLIKAIHQLQEKGQFEGAICLIVGEGKERKFIESLIHKYNMNEQVKILPAISDIEELNNIADFCVLSSIHEAAPFVVLEAASLKRAHVATSVGFMPSFMGNDEAGIHVAPESPQLLAAAIHRLLIDTKKRQELGNKAYERFVNYYAYDTFIKNMISVYEKALTQEKNIF